MNDLSTAPQPQTETGRTTIDIPNEPKASPGGHRIDDHEANEPPPQAEDVDATAAKGQPREAIALPVVRRRRGRGLLLAGVAIVVVGGATAAGVMYHQPLLMNFNRFRAETLEQMPEIPPPVHPATRLHQTTKPSAAPAPQPAAEQTGTGKADQTNQRQAATPPAQAAGTDKPAKSATAGGAGNAAHPVTKPLAGSGSALSQIVALQERQGSDAPPSEAGVGKGGTAPSSGAGQSSGKETGNAITPSTQAKVGKAAKARITTRIPANTLLRIAHPVQAAIKLRKEAANGNLPSPLYVMSLAGELGLVVDEERTEAAQLKAEVAALRQEMKNQLASFDARLTYEQAKGRLALAGAAHPHLSAADAPPVGIFPEHRLPRAEPVNPSSYRVQAASPGLAILSRDGNAYEVSVGNIVPGVGRVLSIQQDGSRWVVQTTHGAIR